VILWPKKLQGIFLAFDKVEEPCTGDQAFETKTAVHAAYLTALAG